MTSVLEGCESVLPDVSVIQVSFNLSLKSESSDIRDTGRSKLKTGPTIKKMNKITKNLGISLLLSANFLYTENNYSGGSNETI